MSTNARGFTLTEVLLASLLAAIVVFGTNSLFNAAVRIQQFVMERSRGSGPGSEEAAAGYAAFHVTKHLEVADRVVRLSADSIQLRVVPENQADLDDPTLYRWDQYRWDAPAQEFRFYEGSVCASPLVLARQITGFTIDYRDRGPLDPPTPPAAPPGLGPVFITGPEDNNIMEIVITWSDGTRGHAFRFEHTSRQMGYTDLGANAGDSGSGLLAPGDTTAPGLYDPDPPAAC